MSTATENPSANAKSTKPFNDFNKMELTGRLGQDPKVIKTEGGKVVAEVSIAIQEGWINKSSGEEMKRTHWITVTAYDQTAVALGEFKKGQRIHVEGKLFQQQWKDKETNETRSKHTVRAISVRVPGKAAENASQYTAS